MQTRFPLRLTSSVIIVLANAERSRAEHGALGCAVATAVEASVPVTG